MSPSDTLSPQVGVFGGTFDPPHWGHINLALSLMEAHQLQEVWFLPTSTNPHKKDRLHTSADHRLHMTELAVENVPNFFVRDVECQRGGISYTVDTLQELVDQEQQRPQPRQLRLLLGADAAHSLGQWRNPLKILQLAPPLIGHRPGTPIADIEKLPNELKSAILAGSTAIPIMDVSATRVRERLKNGLYCGHLVPAKILDYIEVHRLY